MDSEDEIILPDKGDYIIRTRNIKVPTSSKGIGYELYTSMKKHQNKLGQIEADSGIEETFGVILERSIRVACHLRKLGITDQDVATPCTTNHINTSVVFHAILFTGAKVASIDPFAPNEDKIRQLKLVKPKVVFAIPECVNGLEEMIETLGLETKIIVFGKTAKHLPFDKLLVPLLDEENNFSPYTTTNIYETALIVFSSGTTGIPKGVCISHCSAILGALAKGLSAQEESNVFLSYGSLMWNSVIGSTISTTILGEVKLQASGFNPQKALEYLERYKVTVFFVAPHNLVAFLKAGKPKKLKLPCLKLICPTGGILSEETVLKLRETFSSSIIFTAYGQTELWNSSLAPDVTPNGIEAYVSRPNTCGKPVEGSSYKIVNPETGEILGPNQTGELCIKSLSNMNGYYKGDSADRFDKDGFLKTGDIMRYDEEYWFFFVGRQKEMLRFKLTTMFPTELERILLQHPSVKLSVVLGIPTTEGDLATAIVVKKDDKVTAEDLECLIAGKVHDSKTLRGGVYFVEEHEIPFTPTGKIKRRALRDYILTSYV